jgi:hypothetical protein
LVATFVQTISIYDDLTPGPWLAANIFPVNLLFHWAGMGALSGNSKILSRRTILASTTGKPGVEC